MRSSDRNLVSTLSPRCSSSPAVKPSPRGGEIDASERRTAMPRCIQQHVADRIPDLARRPQDPRVVAIRQQPPTPPKHTPHRPGHPPAQTLHPPTERVLILRLDDKVRVVPQERVVHHPKLPPVAPSCQRLLKRPHKRRSPQRRSTFAHPQGHVARIPRRETPPTSVTNQRIRPSLAPRPLAPPAMTRQRP